MVDGCLLRGTWPATEMVTLSFEVNRWSFAGILVRSCKNPAKCRVVGIGRNTYLGTKQPPALPMLCNAIGDRED